MADMDRTGDAWREWTIACYHEAENDIRWAKERSSAVTYWSVLLSGAIVLSSKEASLGTLVAEISCVIQSAVAALWLIDLHCFAKSARDWVHENLPKPGLYPIKTTAYPHHTLHLITQCLIVIGAAFVALAMVG